MDVEGYGLPSIFGVGEPHVVGGDQSCRLDVDQAMTQDIVTEQDLPWSTRVPAQIQASRSQVEPLFVADDDLAGRQVHLTVRRPEPPGR